MPATFVFFQVGNTLEPRILVRSIRKVMPDARIIQCSDKDTSRVDGVSELFAVDGDARNLMTLRLKAFSTVGVDGVAAYLDSDMVLLRPLDPGYLLGEMPEIYHYWFGDQEAIKALVQSKLFQIKKAPGAVYACLPDKVDPGVPKPRLMHFKGQHRKEWMMDYWK